MTAAASLELWALWQWAQPGLKETASPISCIPSQLSSLLGLGLMSELGCFCGTLTLGVSILLEGKPLSADEGLLNPAREEKQAEGRRTQFKSFNIILQQKGHRQGLLS